LRKEWRFAADARPSSSRSMAEEPIEDQAYLDLEDAVPPMVAEAVEAEAKVEVTAEAVEAVEAEAAESEDENEEAAAAAPGPRFEDDPEAQIAMLQVKVTAHLPTVRTLRSQTDDGGGDLGQLTVPQLKQRCREAGLKLSGRKAQLVQRLLSTEADTASSVEEASTESHSAPGSSTAAASAKLRMSKKAKLWHEELMAQQKDELAELRKQVEDLKEENEQLNSSGAAGQGTSTFETEVTHAACTVAFSKFKNGTEFKQALAALNANTTSTGIAALRKELVSTIINNHVP